MTRPGESDIGAPMTYAIEVRPVLKGTDNRRGMNWIATGYSHVQVTDVNGTHLLQGVTANAEVGATIGKAIDIDRATR